MQYRFYGGVHPEGLKSLTSDRPVKRPFVPAKVVIPLSQHVGVAAEPVVKAGDSVKIGQMIGRPAGVVSSAIHASISGKVVSVSPHPTPTLARSLSVTIQASDEDQDLKTTLRKDAGSLPKEELLDMISRAGVVGLGGAGFPTHVKLSPPKTKAIDSIILNGVECEPYLTCDHRLMLEKPKEILKGLDIVAKILDVKDIYIAIEDNKLSAAYAMERAIGDTQSGARLIVLRTKYPQGAEKQVIKAVLNRIVPAGGLPMDVGCVVHNVGTALAIYEAVYLSKPLIDRVVTLTGPCIKEPMNITVRIGTLLSDLVKNAGGFAKEAAKVVAGGPMMGIAQYTLDIPVTKGMGGALFLSKDDISSDEEGVCIRCAKCVEICPMGLSPTSLANYVKKEMFAEAKAKGIANCFECGACAYECPAKIPLLDYMKYGKAKM